VSCANKLSLIIKFQREIVLNCSASCDTDAMPIFIYLT
jgi:hypothetical protein